MITDMMEEAISLTDQGEDLQQVVQEAYIGRTPRLREIERNFQSLVDKHRHDEILLHASSIMTSQEIENIKNLTKEEFGFERVGFDMAIAAQMNVAATVAQRKPFRKAYKVKASKDGFRFVPEAHAELLVFLSSALFKNAGKQTLTGAEITAVYLHEIGHNFMPSIIKRAGFFQPINAIQQLFLAIFKACSKMHLSGEEINILKASVGSLVSLLVAGKAGDLIMDLSDELYNLEKKSRADYEALVTILDPSLYIIDAGMKGYKLGSIIQTIVALATNGVNLAAFGLNCIADIAGKPFGYLGERFSDNFAVMYGYGPELETALAKISLAKAPTAMPFDSAPMGRMNIPVLSQFIDLAYCIPSYVLRISNEHPVIAARFRLVEQSLKREIDKCEDPDMRAILMNQYQIAKKNAEEVFSWEEKAKDNLKDPVLFTRTVQGFLYRLGGDVRHLYRGRDIYKSIDKKIALDAKMQ